MRHQNLHRHFPLVPLASVLCLIVGCGGSAKLDKDANLASVTISRGTLQGTPATGFSVNLYASDNQITVTPNAESSTATIQVNGVQVPSGSTSPEITMQTGKNIVDLDVTAQDWDIAQSYPITITKFASTTPISVQDAPGGMPVATATVNLFGVSSELLEGGIPLDATGTNTLGLPAGKFDLVASAPGYAQSSMLGLDPALDTAAALYCHHLGIANAPAVAPVIDRISYSSDGNTWTDVSGGTISDQAANIKFLRVDASGRSGINFSTWGGFGIGLNVDQMPVWSPDTGNYDLLSSNNNFVAKPMLHPDGTTWYQTETVFSIPLTSMVANSTHYLDLVVYDVAYNRAEEKVRVTVQDSASIATDPDLTSKVPGNFVVEATTYGTETAAFALPAESSPTNSYEMVILFTMDTGIRGYEVYRSTNQTSWTKVATTQFGDLDTTGSYNYIDQDPSLTTGTIYYYKVRAFDGNTQAQGQGWSSFSATGQTYFLPSWQLSLVSPADASVSNSLTPTLSFQCSNTTLWNISLVDRFYFLLHIQDKTGVDLLDIPCRYDFVNASLEVQDSASASGWASAVGVGLVASATSTSSGVNISVQVPAGIVSPGETVQWTIFGEYSSGFQPSFFVKTFLGEDATTVIGHSYSFGSDYLHNNAALNGMFTLTFNTTAN